MTLDNKPQVRANLQWLCVLLLTLPTIRDGLAGEPSPQMPDRYQIIADGIPTPLTNVPGDPLRGRAATVNSSQGNCAICHPLPIPEVPVFGNLGPALDGVGARLSSAQLRLRIVNPKYLNSMTIMPSYYRMTGLHRVAQKFEGKPMLSAQEIEDIVTYLKTLQ